MTCSENLGQSKQIVLSVTRRRNLRAVFVTVAVFRWDTRRKRVNDMRYDTPVKALGMCLIESDRFSTREGWGYVQVKGSTYPGREHWASVDLTHLEESDVPLDVRDGTLRQFDPSAKVVWKGELDNWLDDMAELLHDQLDWWVFKHFADEEPVMLGHLVREDIEPGEMPIRFNEDPKVLAALRGYTTSWMELGRKMI